MLYRQSQMRSRTAATHSCTGRLQTLLVFACVLFLCVSVKAQQRMIAGVVADSTGAKIASAEVVFESGGKIVRTRTNERGEFVLMSAAESGTLMVQSPGF